MAPYVLKQARYGYRMGDAPMVDAMVNDALWDAFDDCHMGITAENICQQWNLNREELDAFAFDSQQKAERAILREDSGMKLFPLKLSKKSRPCCSIQMSTLEQGRPWIVLQDSGLRLEPMEWLRRAMHLALTMVLLQSF